MTALCVQEEGVRALPSRKPQCAGPDTERVVQVEHGHRRRIEHSVLGVYAVHGAV